MPPRPPLAFTARVNLALAASNEIGGHIAQNVFYIQQSSDAPPFTNATLASLAGSISSAWGTNVAPHVSSEWSLEQVTVTAVDGTEEQGISSTVRAGTLTSSLPLPPQVAACVSWGIGAAYRGGKPRTYHVGLDMAQLTNVGSNELTTTAAGQIATGWGAFLAAVNVITISGVSTAMGTVSYYSGKALRATPVFRYYLPSPRVNTRLASQRKRSGKLSVGAYEV